MKWGVWLDDDIDDPVGMPDGEDVMCFVQPVGIRDDPVEVDHLGRAVTVKLIYVGAAITTKWGWEAHAVTLHDYYVAAGIQHRCPGRCGG